MDTEKCVNCGISDVPLHLGLDGRKHCADHIWMLIPAKQEEEFVDGQAENAEENHFQSGEQW